MFHKPRPQTIKAEMDPTSRISRCSVCIRRRTVFPTNPVPPPSPPPSPYRIPGGRTDLYTSNPYLRNLGFDNPSPRRRERIRQRQRT